MFHSRSSSDRIMNSVVHFVPSIMRIASCRILPYCCLHTLSLAPLLRRDLHAQPVSLGNIIQPCFERPRALLQPRRLSCFVAF